MLKYSEIVAEVAEHIAKHDSHGYSQPNRAGTGGIESFQLSDGTWVKIHTGDYDCSEMVRTCVAAAGLLDWDYWSSYMWTGNEDEVLRAAGYQQVVCDPDILERGDILWKTGHTGIYLGNYYMADAHGDEYGGISGPNTGDQTGREIEIRNVYSCNWTRAYRYMGPERSGATPSTPKTYGDDTMTPTKFRFVSETVIRDAPTMNSNIVAQGADGYMAGDEVTIDSLAYADGIVWGGYTGGSGNRRWVAIGYTSRVVEV